MEELKLIVLDNAYKLGQKTDSYLKTLNKEDTSYIIPIERSRFSNGEGKISIKGTVRDKDIYIISDVGNYNVSYKLHGLTHYMAPDEHFQDIKRVISAISGYASKITLVMPLLYESRQHKRKGKESLDCAIALKELEAIGVNHIVTFDAHDPNVANAIPNLPFENFYVAHDILEKLIENENIDNLLVVSPDMGAMERARYYAEILGCDASVFYKRRDLSKVVDGKNPIVEHVYLGTSVLGKDIIVVDDMIASGSSMIEVSKYLKEQGANKVYLVSTFALLTEGVEIFIEAHKQGLFDKLYSTNLSYVPDIIKKEAWYCDVDCSKRLATIINTLHKKESLKTIFDDNYKVLKKVDEKIMNVGIFGGSFNPPHKMHKNMALKLIEHKYLDKIIYVPTGDKYQKDDLIRALDRYNMLKIMVDDISNLEVSDYELNETLTNTYETLNHFKKKYKDDTIYFICGADNLDKIKTWKNYEYILTNFKILVIKRNGDDIERIKKHLKKYKDNIIITDIEEVNLSSTLIRDLLKDNKDVSKYIDKPVLDYIKENNLFKN